VLAVTGPRGDWPPPPTSETRSSAPPPGRHPSDPQKIPDWEKPGAPPRGPIAAVPAPWPVGSTVANATALRPASYAAPLKGATRGG